MAGNTIYSIYLWFSQLFSSPLMGMLPYVPMIFAYSHGFSMLFLWFPNWPKANPHGFGPYHPLSTNSARGSPGLWPAEHARRWQIELPVRIPRRESSRITIDHFPWFVIFMNHMFVFLFFRHCEIVLCTVPAGLGFSFGCVFRCKNRRKSTGKLTRDGRFRMAIPWKRCTFRQKQDGGFLKRRGFLRSPWVSIPKWSNFGWLGVPWWPRKAIWKLPDGFWWSLQCSSPVFEVEHSGDDTINPP